MPETKRVEQKKPRKIKSMFRRKPKETPVAEAKETQKEIVPGDPFDVIRFILMTEKSIQLIESQNKLVFIVNRKSSKNGIKKAFENAFSTEVREVKTVVDQKNRKRAYVRLKKQGEAGEIAIRLGII